MATETNTVEAEPDERPRVGISACLLGAEVRYDGRHKRDRCCAEVLSREFELLPVCPEVEAGLGTPRPPIHLRRIDGRLRLTNTGEPGSETIADVTAAITAVANRRAAKLDGISGFIFKQRSPSCGLRRVAVADSSGGPLDHSGVGLFAARFSELHPLLPLSDEGLLGEPAARASFLRRVHVLHLWQSLEPCDIDALLRFHQAQRVVLQTDTSIDWRGLDRIASDVQVDDLTAGRARYIHALMQALAR